MSEATFTSRSVLVAGPTRGIGQAIATRFGWRGRHVLVAASQADFDADYRSKKRDGVLDDAST